MEERQQVALSLPSPPLPPPHLIVDIEQSEVVTSRSEEIGSSIICEHNTVLGSIEDGIVDRQHGGNGEYLFATLVPASAIHSRYV